MWRKRRGSLGGNTPRESPNPMHSHSLTSTPSMSITSSSPFFGSDPNANDRALVFRLEVPKPGPLGLDLRARHIERDKPQRGAVVKGFRPLQGGDVGYVESTGRVKVGDILQIIHKTPIDDMPFEQIVKHAMQLQKDPTAWPLAMEFRREPEKQEREPSTASKPRRNSFFRSSISMSNPVQDGNFNEKLQYFRDFFATRIPTGGAAPKEKGKPPKPPKWDTVDEMYRELMSKRGVPEDVMDELIRIESLETKWHVVWYAQQNDLEDNTKSNATEAEKFAENLVELKWGNKGLKDLEALRAKIGIASTDWLEVFLAHFGLDYLTMKLPDPSPFPIEHSKYEKATRVCEVILRILRSLTHFTAGVEAITNTPGLVKRVALCFHTDNGDVKKYTLQLLGIVCYNSAAGHTAVIEAFGHYKETKGEAIRFSCLRDALKSTRYSLVFKEDVLSFVNIIVNKAIRLEDRLAIRSDFMALKMAGYFEEIRAKSLAVQRTKYPLASSASTVTEESSSGFPSPVPGAPATPSPIPNKHIAKNTPSPVLSGRSAESPLPGRGKDPGTPVGRLDSLKALGGRRSSITRSADDQIGGRLSASKSAPPSPIDREPGALSPDGAIVRSSLPTEYKGVSRFGTGGNSIISSSVTQLRNQLDNMEKQIDVFEQFMEDDRKDTIYEQTDLASVDSVYRSLFDSVTNDPELQACFLSILQQLLFIPGDRVIGKEMWALSEKVMKQITLLAPVEEVRNFELGYDDRKTLLKMRDRYAQFLQKCADEDPTFQFRMGPIILIENKDRDNDELLSDVTADETDEEDAFSSVAAHEHPELMKYFKLLNMGMPMQHVQLKMSSEIQTFDPSILETPDKVIQLSKPEEKKGTRAEEHEKFAKFFKLKKMGMPMPHIQSKMSAEGLDSSILETPDLLLDDDGNELTHSLAGTGFAGIPVKDHDKFAKFFKLLKMGMPLEHVQLKASSEGLDASLLSKPDQLLDEEGRIFIPGQSKEGPKGIPVKEHEKFAKFFKLMKMGMPLEHIKLKASAEGLDGELLSTPDALVNEDGSKFVVGADVVKGVPVREHEKFAKFFKLMKMGMPLEHIKLKVSAEGLDGELLSTPDVLVDEDGKKVEASAEQHRGVPVKEHEKFAKFFKLLKMGMPMDHVKLKASSEGLDANLLETPDRLVDADGKEYKGDTPAVKGVPVKEHEKFAKFFKLMKMGMPLPHIKLKAASEGLDADLLDTPDKLVDEDGKEIKADGGKTVKASEHPSYAKYFKLLKMGMPRPQLELKMCAESLDPKVLETPDAMIPEDLSVAGVAKAPVKPVVAGPPKPKLRNLYWEAVKTEETAGTIWEKFAKEDEKKAEESAAPAGPPSVADLFAARGKGQQPKSAVSKKDKVLDKFVDQLSDIFVNKPPKAKESEAKKPMKRRAPTRVALIDAKRANNIGIMLARFRLPYYKLRNAVLLVDKKLLSVERVSALLQFAPEDEELDAVRGYTGDPKLLGDAEQYFREMICVPRLTTRLQAIHATWQFDAYVEEQRKLMESVSNACQELQACEALKEIFRVVLSLGNALNDGTSRGGAKGFRLNILLKLNQVKAADNSINLLNYVAKVLRAKDPAILEFDKSLPSIESASRVTTQVLKAGESAVRKAANLICNELEVHAKLPEKEYPQPDPVPGSDEEPEKITDRFQEVIKPFADNAKKSSEQIADGLESMTKRFEETASFYGEDPSSPDCGPDSFFSIFYSFAKVLQSADRDNERKRIAEERRIRREEETKKRLEQLKLKKKKSSFATLKTGDVDDIVSKIRAKRSEEKRREMQANGSAPPSSTGSNRGSGSAPRNANNSSSTQTAAAPRASEVPTPAMEAV
ncbi:Formin like protein [Phytophthora megakarya]|uniref:Formin like protein n=1 Tax=Phytophthora megakarya TaxID=4795 RepID=A0A225WPM3_9STRA|nr:Formin like protein [Phytophthora megakarya]